MYPHLAGLLLLAALLAACSDPPLRVEIPFAVTFANTPIACDSDGDVQLTDLRFFVADVRLIDAAGEAHALALDSGPWQQANIALLDLEDGSAACVNGTADTNRVLTGTIAAGDYRALAFTLGVPFADNHRDPLLAAAPLDDAAMHWHWRGGYKFLRAGVRKATDGFWMHLGSTGCEGTLQNITACNAPNRVPVALDDFVPGRDLVRLDLAALVAAGELEDGIASDCSSGPAEESCAGPFAAFGLGHAGGKTNAAQRVFSSHPSP